MVSPHHTHAQNTRAFCHVKHTSDSHSHLAPETDREIAMGRLRFTQAPPWWEWMLNTELGQKQGQPSSGYPKAARVLAWM